MQINGSSIASNLMDALNNSVDDPVHHGTARLSRSQFSYSFRVSRGQKILRLHFYPASYEGFEGFHDLFVVESGHFILLSNFSASINSIALGVRSIVKEYYLNIGENEQLNLVFTSLSSSMYAFVNGIEIISMPPRVSYFDGDPGVVRVVGKSRVYVDSSTALEMVYRRNTLQRPVLLDGDIRDLFGMWGGEGSKAKRQSYTWRISVDVGFSYLVRLYFSPAFEVSESGDFVFEVSINNRVVDSYTDRWNEKNGMVLYRDYVVVIKGREHQGKRDLLICVSADGKVVDGQELLKEFEILKMSNFDNSLASPNPLSYPAIEDSIQVLGARTVIPSDSIALLALGCFVFYVTRRIRVSSDTIKVGIMPSARAQGLCRRFTLAEIRQATKGFSGENLIGKAGFGKVYKGLIDKERKAVAVKQLKPNARQGSREFLNEIEVLTRLRHDNLVSLVGYCNDNGEMIIVYELLGCGSVAKHLYKRSSNNADSFASSRASLTWKRRLDICIGAGRGLDYLHKHSLIHRDVNASNILLDGNFKAKVSDLGLVKHLSRSKLQSRVKTKVKGTHQYTDPSYATTGVLTQKSDVYSFGVFLLEVLSGRAAVDPSLGDNECNLVPWFRENISEGHLDRLVASDLLHEIPDDSLKIFLGIAERCLDGEPVRRPAMAQVVQQLEWQQETPGCPVPYWLQLEFWQQETSDDETGSTFV
ncbi:receptor-like protein kinase FERONIA [Salvia hispanica]|uniref:receptor-like protein kinase FERONIA n=1 Tax=Salvia hispanica TaxID=49212 RepID=UPI0020091D0E|nr:receptor-like protein kinase FERONIA [Salvia hispanica]